MSKQGGNGNNLPALSPEVMQQLAQNQARELQIRAEELAIKKQQDSHSFTFAQKALDVQAKDREQERSAKTLGRKHTYWFVCVLVLIVFAFLAYLVSIDKDAIAMELVKAAVYLGGGGFAGFYYGKTKQKSADDSSE